MRKNRKHLSFGWSASARKRRGPDPSAIQVYVATSLQGYPGFSQDRRVETFREPILDRREQTAGFIALALVAPEAGEAGSGAQLVNPGILLLCNR
jgi:hypothetical protein